MLKQQVEQPGYRWKGIWISILLLHALFLYPQADHLNTELPADRLVQQLDSVSTAENEIQAVPQAPGYIPSKETIASYKKEYRFNYQLEDNPMVNLKEQLIGQILYFLLSFVSTPFGFAFLLLIVSALFIWWLVRIGVIEESVFKRRHRGKVAFSDTFDPDEASVYDFDSQIAKSIQQKEYRQAVRLYFIKNLKALSDKELIVWDINKTNNNYIYEIQDKELRANYAKSSLVFDYIWYGEFEVDESDFNSIRQQYESFYAKVMGYGQ